MELFSFDYQSHHFKLILDLDLQLERLFLDDALMSVKPLDSAKSVHNFDNPVLGVVQLSFTINPFEKHVAYQLQINDAEPISKIADMSEAAKAAIVVKSTNGEFVDPSPKENHTVGLFGIGFKLLKSIKVVKVALAALTLGAYTMLFSFEFALALIAVLVFHELGHVRAMKKFGIPTKGFYLIPFWGGIAVGDQAKTRWEDIYIAIMGPIHGLLLSMAFFVMYWITGSHFCGLVASVSAFVNLINLFPVLPLDGGRVIRSLVFSRRNYWSLVLFLTISALGAVLAWTHGYGLLVFFMVVGTVDVIIGWNTPLHADLTPLKTYGIWFCLLWYLVVVAALLAMIVIVYHAGVPGSELAISILKS